MQYAERADRGSLIENISNAPDFALISHDPKQVLLVEVKYRYMLDMEEVKETAKRICEQWKMAWIFYATPLNFYFDFCADIEHQDKLTSLEENMIPKSEQQEYLKLLREFV